MLALLGTAPTWAHLGGAMSSATAAAQAGARSWLELTASGRVHILREQDVPTHARTRAGVSRWYKSLRQRAAAFRRSSHLRGERGDPRIRDRSEALDCSEASVTSDWIRPYTTRWRSVVDVGRASAAAFRGAGERLDVHDLRAEALERGACVEVAVLSFLGYPGLGAAISLHRRLLGSSVLVTSASRYVQTACAKRWRCPVLEGTSHSAGAR
jgi:hypothetical protein